MYSIFLSVRLVSEPSFVELDEPTTNEVVSLSGPTMVAGIPIKVN